MRLALSLSLASLLLAVPVHAQELELEYATGTVCDTQKEMERYVAVFDGDAAAAIATVNAEEHDPSACALATVTYLRGPELGTARNKNSAFQIVRILVVGVATAQGIQVVKPAALFTIFGIREYAV